MKYRYCIEGNNLDPNVSSRSVFENNTDIGPALAAKAAKKSYNLYYGWQYDWPLTFHILRENGYMLGRYEMQRFYDPRFEATSKEYR